MGGMKLPLFIFFKIFRVLSLTNSNCVFMSSGNCYNCVTYGCSFIVLMFVDGAEHTLLTVPL